MSLKLELPTLQNWSCHSCGGCCTQHGIFITEAEKERIEKQGWNASNGVPDGQPIFVKMGGWLQKSWYRLAHQPNGGCVFLDENSLCRIHARFGEPAKPLACRIYPYAFHPDGKGVSVGLRFSCPSVVSNKGKAVTQQRSDLLELARQVVPDNVKDAPAPKITPASSVDWSVFHEFNDALDDSLTHDELPLVMRWLWILEWVGIVEQSRVDRLTRDQITEFLQVIREAAAQTVPTDLESVPEPNAIGRTQFRLLAGHYGRKDSYGSNDNTLAGRWRLMQAAMQLTSGKGLLPALQPELGAVPFTQLETPFGVPDGADELLERYFRIKVQGLSYCGAAFYKVSFVEGVYSLALVYPVVLWLARWLAVTAGRNRLELKDVEKALAIADHHHGYSPALGTWGFRKRVQSLASLNNISALCVWYSR